MSKKVRQSLQIFLRSNSEEEKIHNVTPPKLEQREEQNIEEDVNLEFLSDDNDNDQSPSPKIICRKIRLNELVHINPSKIRSSNLINYQENTPLGEQEAQDNSQEKIKINLSSLFNI
mmetsp:Transcript_19825/g.17520  ORF Transcript_19825/g.17520 Transcript_19825/m.17520 type:complete len:117 (+) Transcript_19825:292-642(+)